MIYTFSLQSVGFFVGAGLLLTHIAALALPSATQRFLRTLPRSRPAGAISLAAATIWGYWLVSIMDLGEFSPLRGWMLIGIPMGAVLAWLFVNEFLCARALGILALLAADPLLEAAFLRHETSRLLLVVLAYVWIVAGLFLVGMPYLLRDWVNWLASGRLRFRSAAVGGIAYGAIVLFCGVFLWGS